MSSVKVIWKHDVKPVTFKWQNQAISENKTVKYVEQFKNIPTDALYYSVKILHLKH